MFVQKTVQVVIEPDADLRGTLDAFTAVCNQISPTAYNSGKPLSALGLHKAKYHAIKGTVSSQLTCTAIRLTAGAYVAARKNGHAITRPFQWKTPCALFLIGKVGRDASFKSDGTMSIWTIGGRKRLRYHIPGVFQEAFDTADVINSVVIVPDGDKFIGHACVTHNIPNAPGIVPVGIDLNETNAIVAVDADNRTLFITGLRRKVLNTRTRKTTARLQSKAARSPPVLTGGGIASTITTLLFANISLNSFGRYISSGPDVIARRPQRSFPENISNLRVLRKQLFRRYTFQYFDNICR